MVVSAWVRGVWLEDYSVCSGVPATANAVPHLAGRRCL